MGDRYIRRFALPERLYAPGAPVVLAAGVLLEDTCLPRLVAQLKWKSIDPRPLTALTVEVRCPGAAETVFTYTGLDAVRGTDFGRYTAVALPPGDARSMEVRALSAVFADGVEWTAPADAVWTALPAFVPLEQAAEPELLALTAPLPRSRYAYWSGAEVWYCPCGGVNREGEERCHRCGCERTLARRMATAGGLRAEQSARAEERARLEAEEQRRRAEVRVRAEAVRRRMDGLKARLRRPAPAQSAPEGQAASQTRETARAAPRRRPWKRRLWAVGAAGAVILAAALVLPRLQGDSAPSLPGLSAGAPLHVTAPGDAGTVLFTVEEDAEGVCTVTPELVREQIPGVEYINLAGVPDMGNDIDAYLINSFQMAILVTSGGEYGSEGEWGSFDANRDPDSPLCLLLYDGNFHLMGHAVGAPEKAGDGVWQLEVTLCDYDFTALFQEQLSAFTDQYGETFSRYIAPEDIAASGAEFFLEGYNTGRGPTLLPGDAQTYHLWAQYSSPYVTEHSRGLDRLRDRLPRDDRWRCFLLLDKDHRLLGYTVMDASGAGGRAAGTDITPTGTVDLYLEENDLGQCVFTEELVRQAVPETDFFNFEGFAPDLGGDVKAYVKDSLHMAWLVASQGRQRGGHSSATWNLSEDGVFVLLLYRDFTTLCGYFVGAPEDLGDGRWRMEITLCGYDFTALYEEQAAGRAASLPLPEIAREDLASCGAAWYIEPVSQLSGGDDFSHRVRLQSLWSRAMSPQIGRFLRPVMDLPGAARGASEESPREFLLLDEAGRYLGCVTVTGGDLERDFL